MKSLSLKIKITLWVFVLVIIIALLSSTAVLFFSDTVTQSNMKRNLISAVEANINEVEIYSVRSSVRLDDEFDILVEYGGLFIEIDDDFTKETDGVLTTLYSEDGVLYGDGVVGTEEIPLAEKGIRSVKSGGKSYYIYDKRIKDDDADSLWLRGIVPQERGVSQTVSVIRSYLLIIPLLLLISIAGAYYLSRRTLAPIDKISSSADEIQQGNDLTKRIELKSESTEIATLVSSFNGMLERLEGSFERERRFNSDISHELRTPVSVILSASELALEETDESQYIESLELIKRQSEKMSKMISGMLEYSRIGRDSAKPEALDFSSLLNEICEETALIREKNISLESDIESGITIYADRALMARLTENLIMNAYKYGRNDGSIFVSLKNEDGSAVLKVKDNGIGIKSGDTEKIFDAFYRADSSRSQSGFGLGLSFVKAIAELHGGEISVNSVEGVGSEFTYKQKILKN